jgi:hypothetical protein
MKKITKRILFLVVMMELVALTFLVGGAVGRYTAPEQDCVCDCGTLIMRQEIKGWDGYIDVPYDLNQFKQSYEEQIIWHNYTKPNQTVIE